MDGIGTEDAMEESWSPSLHVKETVAESDAYEVDPLIMHEKKVDSLLKKREESSNSTPIDSKEPSTLMGVEDVKTVLRSIFLFK